MIFNVVSTFVESDDASFSHKKGKDAKAKGPPNTIVKET